MKNKLKGILIVLCLVILFSTFVSGKTYQQDKQLDFKIPFEVNGTAASSDAQCNISIKYPNESYLRNNNDTTNLDNGLFNLTLGADETNVLGIYEWVAFCCDGAECASGYGNFEITPSGSGEMGTGEGINLGIALITIVAIALLFFFAIFKSESMAIKIVFGGLCGLFLLISILFTLVILTQTLGGYQELIEGYSTFWMVVKTIVSLLILGITLFALYISFKYWQYKRGFID